MFKIMTDRMFEERLCRERNKMEEEFFKRDRIRDLDRCIGELSERIYKIELRLDGKEDTRVKPAAGDCPWK